MVRLNCTPQDAETLWPPDDPSWAAEDVIESINAARRRMRVPFYIHELPGLRSVEDELARLVACGAETLAYKYNGGEFHFLRALAAHPWRTRDAGEAALFIVPIFTGWENHKLCVGARGITPARQVLHAINATATWRRRSRDHLFVCLDWASSGGALMPGKPGLRAFVEARWSEPMTHGCVTAPSLSIVCRIAAPCAERRSRYKPRDWFQNASNAVPTSPTKGFVTNFLLVAPYVDNGGAADESERVRWRSSERNLSFFWGGSATRKVGPGRKHTGYYMRWHMLGQWAKDPAAFDGQARPSRRGRRTRATLCSPPHAPRQPFTLRRHPPPPHSPAQATFVVADASNRPVVPPCPPMSRADNSSLFPWPKGWPYRHDLTELTHRPPRWPGECMPPCSTELLASAGAGACAGTYSPGAILSRTRFALSPRGDVPSTPRPFDGARCGAHDGTLALPMLSPPSILGHLCGMPLRIA